MNDSGSRIHARGVRKYFETEGGRVDVLGSIDIHVDRHEFVSLLGPSGCGKSTLFNVIAGLDEPSEGEIEVDGYSGEERLGRCGYMMQRDLLMPWKRVNENVALGRLVKGTPRQEALRQADELLAEYGLEGFENHYPGQISGGMRQRAALARTFLAADDVLLLDEPFGALDSLTRLQMQGFLMRVWQESEASILFITHDVDEAIRLSDRVYVLSERPASVATTLTIDIPRPRPYEIVLTNEFTELKSAALAHLHMEPDVALGGAGGKLDG